MTPKGHAIPSKTQLLSYGTPALCGAFLRGGKVPGGQSGEGQRPEETAVPCSS